MHNSRAVHAGEIQVWIMEATCNYICMLKHLLEKKKIQEEIELGFQTSNTAGKSG